jgi:hypothetical protein
MQRSKTGYIILFLVGLGAFALFTMTLLGNPVSEVFSSVDTGLNTGGMAESPPDGSSASSSKPAGAPQPQATAPASLDDELSAEEPAAAEREEMAADSAAGGEGDSRDKETDADEAARPLPRGGPAPLKAGERDDNDTFDEYLDYLERYQGPEVRPVDVRERYFIKVLDTNQQPVLNARVRVYDGDTQVFEGRTYAGGQTLFLPHARDVSANASAFRIEATYGDASAEQTLQREGNAYPELALDIEQQHDSIELDLLFLLDTSGSMGDELNRVQETIDSIARRIDSFTPRPTVRFGLVAYRDRGDDYVTRTYDFTPDVPTFRKLLNSVSADGGGDTPESVNEALHEAVQGVQWGDSAVRLIFLVADAGPHLDYPNDYDYIEETQQAVTQGIKIYPIAASNTDDYAEYVFRQMAQQTMARFIFLTYQPGARAGAPGESTTLDAGDQPYTVERLDDLIVQVVERELAAVVGRE